MKYKLLKLNLTLLLGFGLIPLHGQAIMNVKATVGTQTNYTLSTIRKLTFPNNNNMVVSKTTGSVDNYTISGVRYLKFGDVGTNIAATQNDSRSNIHLYPNPVVDVLHIQLYGEEIQTITVEIFSIEGKLLYRNQLSGTISFQINVSELRQGIYLCRIYNGICAETNKFFKQ